MSSMQFLAFCCLFLTTLVILGFPASASNKGPYLLMQHSNTTANVGVFRLDTSSGGVSYCYVSNSGELMCSKEAF